MTELVYDRAFTTEDYEAQRLLARIAAAQNAADIEAALTAEIAADEAAAVDLASEAVTPSEGDAA